MVLYEDLRVYTFWRTEAAHYRQQHMPYRKTGTEWEILGDLGLRLWHENEAKEAFEQCLDHKFSAKAWMRLLEIYAKEGNVQKALLAAVKLTVYHERWYHEIVVSRDIGSIRSWQPYQHFSHLHIFLLSLVSILPTLLAT